VHAPRTSRGFFHLTPESHPQGWRGDSQASTVGPAYAAARLPTRPLHVIVRQFAGSRAMSSNVAEETARCRRHVTHHGKRKEMMKGRSRGILAIIMAGTQHWINMEYSIAADPQRPTTRRTCHRGGPPRRPGRGADATATLGEQRVKPAATSQAAPDDARRHRAKRRGRI
jgi:hypothetical protein